MTVKNRLHLPAPKPDQVLLMRAALLSGDHGRNAYAAWRTTHVVTELDADSDRVLPLLAYNLDRLGVDDENRDRLRGVWRHTWVNNARLLAGVSDGLRILSEAGIPMMLIKGAALIASGIAPNSGVRPMDDVDVLVRRADAPRAVELLAESGWRWKGANSFDLVFGRAHGNSLFDAERRQIDLHWSSLSLEIVADDVLWERASPADLHGQRVFVPTAADQLVLVCLHGVAWHGAGLRWMLDATLIIQGSEGPG